MTTHQCQRCKSTRVIGINALAKDMFTVRPPGQTWDTLPVTSNGDYAPAGINLDDPSKYANGDAIQFDFCLDCGQMQGEWPVPNPTWWEASLDDSSGTD